jgi:hypothetical protein
MICRCGHTKSEHRGNFCHGVVRDTKRWCWCAQFREVVNEVIPVAEVDTPTQAEGDYDKQR